MNSTKTNSDGIALLSIYCDDDDEYDGNKPGNLQNPQNDAVLDEIVGTEDGVKNAVDRTPVPQSSGVELREGRLTIVDYDDEELGSSPKAEDGESRSTGRVIFGSDLQEANGLPAGAIHVLALTTQTALHTSEHLYPMESDATNYSVNQLVSAEPGEAVGILDDEQKDMDPILDKFLPPPPKAKCSDELQEKIVRILSLKRKAGRSFNIEVLNRKGYRNPNFLEHAVTYQGINPIGSCFSKDVFDPHGYDKSDYYDEIERAAKNLRQSEGQLSRV